MSNTVFFSIIIAVILMVIRVICFQLEYTGWVYFFNKEKREKMDYWKSVWGDDIDLLFEEQREKIQKLDHEWAHRDPIPLSGSKEEPDFSVVSNDHKKQIAINLWDYYYNFMLCRKDLKYSQDSRIRIIYYAKKLGSSIDIMLNPQGTAIQFWNLYIENLKRMAIRKAKVLDSKDLPESIRKKLEKAA